MDLNGYSPQRSNRKTTDIHRLVLIAICAIAVVSSGCILLMMDTDLMTMITMMIVCGVIVFISTSSSNVNYGKRYISSLYYALKYCLVKMYERVLRYV